MNLDEKEIILKEFQSFINWLLLKNDVKHDGTRFGYRNTTGYFVHEKIRDLENEFIEYLRENGFYE